MPSRWLWIAAAFLCMLALLLYAAVSSPNRIEDTPLKETPVKRVAVIRII